MAYWVEVLDKDVQRVEEEHREAARTMEIERFLGQAGVSMATGAVDTFLSGCEA